MSQQIEVRQPRSAGLCIASGSTYPEFADRVAESIDAEVVPVERRKFSNGELFDQYQQSLRGKDVFVVQVHDGQREDCAEWSINDAILEQGLMIDAAKRASAQHITAVCPYFGYSRQDKKADGRISIAGSFIAKQLIAAGAERIMSMDLHSEQIQGFIDGPFDHLKASPELLEWLQQWTDEKGKENVTIVAPDTGRSKVAEKYSNELGVEFAVINKDRSADSTRVRAIGVMGPVASRHCVLLDDMIDTARTLSAAGDLLERSGAVGVIAVATHGILSGPAVDYLSTSPIEKIVVTDTINQATKKSLLPQLEVVSVARWFGKAIDKIHHNESVSEIYEGEYII